MKVNIVIPPTETKFPLLARSRFIPSKQVVRFVSANQGTQVIDYGGNLSTEPRYLDYNGWEPATNSSVWEILPPGSRVIIDGGAPELEIPHIPKPPAQRPAIKFPVLARNTASGSKQIALFTSEFCGPELVDVDGNLSTDLDTESWWPVNDVDGTEWEILPPGTRVELVQE